MKTNAAIMQTPDVGESREIHGMERVMLRVGESMGADLVVGRVTGRIDAEAFRRAAFALVARHPPLRVRVEGSPPQRFVYLPPASAPVEVEIREADPAATTPTWQQAVLDQTTRPFALDGGPSCRFTLVADRGGTEAHAILAAPHALVDGRSLLRLLHDLLTAWAATTEGRAPDTQPLPITPAVATLLRFSPLVRLIAPIGRKVWISETRKHQQQAALPPRVPVATGGKVRTLATFREGTPEGWERLSAACKRHGVTVGAAFLAANWFATARLVADVKGAPPSHLAMDLDIDIRPRLAPPAPDTHVGYYTGFAPLGAKARPATDFWALAKTLRRGTVTSIDRGLPQLLHLLAEPIPDLFEFLRQHGLDPNGGGGTASLVAVSNVGRYPYETNHGPLKLTGLWGLNGACLTGSAFTSWLRHTDGHLFYDAVGVWPAVDQAQLERFQDALYELLENPPDALTVGAFCSETRRAPNVSTASLNAGPS